MPSQADQEVVGLLAINTDNIYPMCTRSKQPVPGLRLSQTAAYLDTQLAWANSQETAAEPQPMEADSKPEASASAGEVIPPWKLSQSTVAPPRNKRPLLPSDEPSADVRLAALTDRGMSDGLEDCWDDSGKDVGKYSDDWEGHWVS